MAEHTPGPGMARSKPERTLKEVLESNDAGAYVERNTGYLWRIRVDHNRLGNTKPIVDVESKVPTSMIRLSSNPDITLAEARQICHNQGITTLSF